MLWPAGRRSRDLTPLYIDLYRGPRTGQKRQSHAFWELTAVMHGTETLVGPSSVMLREPKVCLIPPDYRHDEVADHDVDTIWIGFRCRGIVPSPVKDGDEVCA